MNNFGSMQKPPQRFPDRPGSAKQRRTLAEMLRLHGYSTAAFGKSHETAAWEVSGLPVQPTAGRPARASTSFYGFIGGETNQWAPLIYDGMIQVRTVA